MNIQETAGMSKKMPPDSLESGGIFFIRRKFPHTANPANM